MDADKYQDYAIRTLPQEVEHKDNVMTCALGLGESGEVQNVIKKEYFHGHAIDKQKIVDEIGDMLWYAAALCHLYNLRLSDVLDHNLQKLQRRYPQGFSKERSVNRDR